MTTTARRAQDTCSAGDVQGLGFGAKTRLLESDFGKQAVPLAHKVGQPSSKGVLTMSVGGSRDPRPRQRDIGSGSGNGWGHIVPDEGLLHLKVDRPNIAIGQHINLDTSINSGSFDRAPDETYLPFLEENSPAANVFEGRLHACTERMCATLVQRTSGLFRAIV
ncbi:MAG: hypothetical protein M1836_002633 [Candelina mexicana]|nr:MAG: hypothetical protein M1836_002633 [Candelina mexicana]